MKVYGIPRAGGNCHCYNVVGDCMFDLTSEQFGEEGLSYEQNPEQFRKKHFAKEEKRLRYEYLKAELQNGILEQKLSFRIWTRIDNSIEMKYHIYIKVNCRRWL